MTVFKETRNIFETSIPCKFPLTYDEWLDCPDRYKASALYVNFYDTITFAWYKVKTNYHDNDDAVSYILQYLCKNVPKIIETPSRYSERYIYRVAYNCFTCILYGPKKDRITSEVSNLQYTNSTDKEVDLFSFIPHKFSMEDIYIQNELWRALYQLGPSVVEFAEDLINKGKVPKTLKKDKREALNKLIEALENFVDCFN